MRRLRVLVAEDDASAREVIVQLLEHHGHEVDGVADGPSLDHAIRHAAGAGRPYDVVVSDVRMPGRSTFEVLRSARDDRVMPRTILLTAYPEDAVFYQAYQCDCLCVIAKPFDAAELRRIVSLAAHDVAGRAG